jgi:DnaJ-class molecular chaperone
MGEERVARVMCRRCDGDGVVWEPKMAVPWGSNEAVSLLAPTQCRDCGGEGWFELALADTSGGSGS